MSWSQITNNLGLIGLYLILGFSLGWAKFLMVQIPLVFLFSVIAFWFFYMQHQHHDTYMQWKDKWEYLLASMKGSTYYKLPRPINWLTGNIGFHHIHHLSSRIPNYNLQKCAKENPILQKCVTVLTFRKSLQVMFNKLWDEEKQKMITFKEFYQLEASPIPVKS